jgi:phage regulator Rha-like protein
MAEGPDFFEELEEIIENTGDFFDELAEYEAECKARLLKFDFFYQLQEAAKHNRITKILARLHRVQDFDPFDYIIEDSQDPEIRYYWVKKKHKQKSMLIGILSTLYNYTAFGYTDKYILQVLPRRRWTFLGLRRYYRKYTGPLEGPRFKAAYAERMREIQEKENAKKNGYNTERYRGQDVRTVLQRLGQRQRSGHDIDADGD